MTVVVKKSPATHKGKRQKAATTSRKRVKPAPKDPSPQFHSAPVAIERLEERIKTPRTLKTITAGEIKIKNASDTVVKPQQKKSPAYSDTIPLKAIENAGKEASSAAMEMMGYTIIEVKGWVVKKYANGAIEKISRI